MKTKLFILLAPLVTVIAAIVLLPQQNSAPWSEQELVTLQSLWIKQLPPLPSDPSNRLTNDDQAAKFGQQLFFDSRFSKNGQVACATCHQPERKFTDGLALAEGMKVGNRNTMSLVGAAYSPWYFWDGRTDSLWSQALGPLESAVEHGGNRYQFALLVSLDNNYRRAYEELFGPFPDLSVESAVTEVFVNLGKSIAAYEQKLLPGVSRFDNYLDNTINGTSFPQDQLLSKNELAGLRLFIGQAQCMNCHNGPLLTNFSFHNTGIFPRPGGVPDMGRVSGVSLVREDPFNCLSKFNDSSEKNCDELMFMKTGDELIGAQKTPSLRSLIGTEPYMHAGQFTTLQEVLNHYNTADGAFIGHNEAKPLNLNQTQLHNLEAFLRSLDAPINAEEQWLQAPEGMAEQGGKLTRRSHAY